MKNVSSTAYQTSFGELPLPEGAREMLEALPIEEQVKHFSVSVFGSMYRPHEVALTDCSDLKSVIVKDGIIVGAMLSNEYGSPTPCRVGETICTWDSEDNNGAGYKCRTDYATLLFNRTLPEK